MFWPIGTPEEVKELGLDVTSVRTCSTPGQKWVEGGELMKQVGCEFWHRELAGVGKINCLFASKCPAIGKAPGVEAFRGHGPKTVAVFVQLDKEEKLPGQIMPPSKIMFMPCFTFENSMRARYESQRETGEIIAVAGVEGDGRTYAQGVVEDVENPQDPRGPKRKVVTTKMLEIPKFPRPSESLGDVQMGRSAAAALKGQNDEEIAQAMESHIGEMVGTAPLPKYEPEKEKGGKAKG
jgi:hypothetical protein